MPQAIRQDSTASYSLGSSFSDQIRADLRLETHLAAGPAIREGVEREDGHVAEICPWMAYDVKFMFLLLYNKQEPASCKKAVTNAQ